MAVIEQEPTPGYWDGRGARLLWLTIVSGPAAWALNQLVGYALVKPVCAAGVGPALVFLSAGALAVTGWGAWTAWSRLRLLRGATEHGPHETDRSHFMALSGLMLNLFIALLIVTAAVPPFLLSPCE